MRELTQDEAIEIRKTLLYEFHNMCEKNNIKYSLGYGTLLGAVRHGGMIPWDDDIDVIVPRKDFETLCEIYNSDKCLDRYQFVTHRNHPEIKTKIGYYIDFGTITETAYQMNTYHGVHIDIYPIDVVPNNCLQRNKLFLQRRFLHTLIRAKDVHPNVVKGIQKLIRKFVLLLCLPFNYDKALDKLHTVSKKYMYLPDTEKITACIFVETGKPLCFPYIITTEYHLYQYDNYSYWGFKNYDCLLKIWYGDYMTFPPVNEQHKPEHKFVHFYYKDEI